jgi:hypothetical protein
VGAGYQRWWNHGRYQDECLAADLHEPITGDLVAWWRRQWLVPLFPPPELAMQPASDCIQMRVRLWPSLVAPKHFPDGV